MTARYRRRRPTLQELVRATEQLAQGVPMPQCAQQLGVTRGTLEQALLDMAWRHWCHVCGVPAMPRPQGAATLPPVPKLT